MVLVTCEKTGIQFEADTRRTKNHPTIMGWLNEAAKDGWYNQALSTIKQGREQGFTTIEQFADALRATEESHKCASNAVYAAENARKRAEQDARRERATTNAFLRDHAYKWHKFEHDEEDVDLLNLPEVEWTLYSPDNRAVSLKEAMLELAYADVRFAKEWLAKHNIAEELPAIEQQRREEAQRKAAEAEQQAKQMAALSQEDQEYIAFIEPRLIEAGLSPERARKEAIRHSQPHSPQEDGVELGPVHLPNGKTLMLVINGDGRYGFTGYMGLWTGLQEVLDKFPEDAQLHTYLAPYLERNTRNSEES
jgi:hypothetical protein